MVDDDDDGGCCRLCPLPSPARWLSGQLIAARAARRRFPARGLEGSLSSSCCPPSSPMRGFGPDVQITPTHESDSNLALHVKSEHIAAQDTLTVSQKSDAFENASDLHRRPHALPARRRNAGLVELRCNGPQACSAGRL